MRNGADYFNGANYFNGADYFNGAIFKHKQSRRSEGIGCEFYIRAYADGQDSLSVDNDDASLMSVEHVMAPR